MKKNILIAFVLLIAVLYSCQEEYEPGGTAVQEMAGTWTVYYNHPVFGEDPFGSGLTQLYTYNTSSNSETEFWLSDLGHFWDFKVKVPINLSNLTFGTTDTLINAVDDYDIKVIVRNGKIIKNAATPPSGLPVDSIYFEIWFEDLEGSTGIASDTLLVGGFRYTGWPEDE